MNYRILTSNGVNNTNIDGARAEYFNSGMRDGIVKGVLNEGTLKASPSNGIFLDTCELRISGHRVVIDEAYSKTFSTIPVNDTRYALVAQITVDYKSSNISFSLLIQDPKKRLSKPELFRDPSGAGIYQLEIGKFTLDTGCNVVEVTRTVDVITGSRGEDLDGTINIGTVTTNTLEAGLEAEVDIEQRYDEEQKKVLTDFNFGIPSGRIENLDNQLSYASTNAVQNNVIAAEFDRKADLVNGSQIIHVARIVVDSVSSEEDKDSAIYIQGENPRIVLRADDNTPHEGIIRANKTGDMTITSINNILLSSAGSSIRIKALGDILLESYEKIIIKDSLLEFQKNGSSATISYDADTDTFII